MKKFLKKFLLANFFISLFFSSFFLFFSENNFVNAWSPAKIDSSILSDTDDRIIVKKVTWTYVQSSSLFQSLIPNLFQLAFYLWSSIAVLALVYWWYVMLTWLWSPSNQEKWWKIFWFSIAWLVLMLFSRAIVWIVSNIKIVKPVDDEEDGAVIDTINWAEYWLQWSAHIWNLPSWNIETEVIPNIVQLALQFVSVVVIWIVIYAWIMYITKAEDKKSEMADLFINAVIWLIIILTSYVLVAWVLKINFW